MAILTIYTQLTATSIRGQHPWKPEVVRHRVATVNGPSSVVSVCGRAIDEALPWTYQAWRPCAHCGSAGGATHIGLNEAADDDAHGFTLDSEERARQHALWSIRQSSGRSTARQIARAMGYVPPEKILEVYPEIAHKIVYVRPELASRAEQRRMKEEGTWPKAKATMPPPDGGTPPL